MAGTRIDVYGAALFGVLALAFSGLRHRSLPLGLL